MNFISRPVLGAILGSFFCSGLAGLLYQVVWTRYLALFLGHTSYAVVAVLVAFMGGLAVGNAWLGARVDRLRRPLMFYAGLEFGIGLYAVFFPGWFEVVRGWFLMLVRSWAPTGTFRLAVQFTFACVLVLPPAVLMGATLPALTRFVTRSLGELRGRVAALYAINSSGAVAGVILADWYLVPGFGLELTGLLGALVNFAVALVAAVLSWKIETGRDAQPETSSTSAETFTEAERRIALIGAGISGFVAMLYEIAWTRLLGLALGSSTHAYSLMLATFITGIAVGGGLLARWKRQGRTLAAFGWAEVALAVTTLGGMWVYDLMPYWFLRLSMLVSRSPDAYALSQLMQAGICFLVMFVPAVCLGLTLPLASRVATASLTHSGRSVGRVFAVNTLGTVLGAALTGLVLLPWLGLGWTLALGGILNAFLGLAALAVTRDGGLTLSRAWVGSAAAMILGLAAGRWAAADWASGFALGIWRFRLPINSLTEYRELIRKQDLLYQKDGAGSSVAVMRFKTGTNHIISLRVNGKTDAGTGGDVPTQLLAGHIPLSLRPGATRVLVVGAGSGMTVGSVLKHPTVQRCDLVEISPEVIEAARVHFGPYNDHALDDPRCTVHLEDAKTFLQVTTDKYDVIISEPSNPWMAGVAGVFSLEYYQACQQSLKPGGLMVQWIQTYETDNATFDLVTRTFTSIYPNTELWQTVGGDLLLVGAEKPFNVDLNALAAECSNPTVRASLKRAGVLNISALLAHQAWAQGDTRYTSVPGGPIHSDYRPTLEYAAQRGFFVGNRAVRHEQFNQLSQVRSDSHLARWWRPQRTNLAELSGVIFSHLDHKVPRAGLFLGVSKYWRSLSPGDTRLLELDSSLNDERQFVDAELEHFRESRENLFAVAAQDPELLRLYAMRLMFRHRNERSVWYLPPTVENETVLQRLVEVDPANRRTWRAQLAEIAYDRGEDAACEERAALVFAPDTAVNGPFSFGRDVRAPQQLLARLIDLYLRRGNATQAGRMAEFALQEGHAGPTCKDPFQWLEMQIRKADDALERQQIIPAPAGR